MDMEPTTKLQPSESAGQWLRHLRDRAQEWVRAGGGLIHRSKREGSGVDTPIVESPVPMDAYTDLVFAFGLARLGANDAALDLLRRAESVLLDWPGGHEADVHQCLCRAYGFRVRRAVEDQPHRGSLPAEIQDGIACLDHLPRYAVDRLRNHSAILEPEDKVDPYRVCVPRDELHRDLADVVELRDVGARAARLEELWASRQARRSASAQATILQTALQMACRDESAVAVWLNRFTPTFDTLSDYVQRSQLLEAALSAACSFPGVSGCAALVPCFRSLLAGCETDVHLAWLCRSVPPLCRFLLVRVAVAELNSLLDDLTSRVLDGRSLPSLRLVGDDNRLCWLLCIACGLAAANREGDARAILQASEQAMVNSALPGRTASALIPAYVQAVTRLVGENYRTRFEWVLRKLPYALGCYTTDHLLSLAALDVLEAVVLAVPEAERLRACEQPTIVDLPALTQ
jgi:hypothetical protein